MRISRAAAVDSRVMRRLATSCCSRAALAEVLLRSVAARDWPCSARKARTACSALIGSIWFQGLLLRDLEGSRAARCEGVHNLFADFCAERKHGAQDFAERSEIIFGNPRAELQQMFGEHRLLIEDTQDGANRCCRNIFRRVAAFVCRRAIMQRNHDALELLATKGNEDAAAYDRVAAVRWNR